MKTWGFVTLLLLLMLPLTALPLLSPAELPPSSPDGDATSLGEGGFVAGRIRIPAADIHAEVMTASHGSDCGCCGTLWQGGIASTTADLSAVQVDDMAELVTVDGDRLVLECVAVEPCVRVGRWLIGWRGVIRAQGDVLVYSGGSVYRFVRL